MAELLLDVVTQWHAVAPPLKWDSTILQFPSDLSTLREQIRRLGLVNCYQWHLEDECRDHYDSQEILANLKRSIDRSNHRRVKMIDDIDYTIFRHIKQFGEGSDTARLSLVTPGNLADRLSILVLKRYHAVERGSDDKTIGLLKEQIKDLCHGIDALIEDLMLGRRRIKFYRTVKLYGNA